MKEKEEDQEKKEMTEKEIGQALDDLLEWTKELGRDIPEQEAKLRKLRVFTHKGKRFYGYGDR